LSEQQPHQDTRSRKTKTGNHLRKFPTLWLYNSAVVSLRSIMKSFLRWAAKSFSSPPHHKPRSRSHTWLKTVECC
jgi:hypothetical protein